MSRSVQQVCVFGSQESCMCGSVCVCVCSLSCVRLFVIPCTVGCQFPLSMEFSRQEYWSGLPFLSPGDLSDAGIKPGSPALKADSLPSEPPRKHKLIIEYMNIFIYILE